MSMKKIFENFREGSLIEKNARWYRTPEEDIPGGKADFPRSTPEKLSKGQKKQTKGIVSFNNSDSDYKIIGDTHGRFSHMIKHAWEFPKLQPIYMTAVYAAQKMIRNYVKKTDENPALPKLYFVKAGQKGQILSYEKGNKDADNPSQGEYRHPEAKTTTSGPIISNTWDYIQDKLQTGEGEIHPTERTWFAIAKPVATVYNRKAQKTMKASKNIANYDDATIEKFWDKGKTISFQNIHDGKQNTNYMNKRGELISKRADGLIATYFVPSTAGKGMPGLNPKIHIPWICNYLSKEDSHPEAKRLAKIICVPEEEPEGEPSPQESPSPNLSPDAVARLALAAAAAAAAGIVATGAGGALGGLKPAVSRLVSRIHLANMVRANVHKAGGLIKRASSFRTFQNAARGSRGVYALRFARIGPLAVLALVADVVLSSALSAGAQAANRRKKCAPTQYGLNRCSGGDALTPEEYAKIVSEEIPKEHAVLSYMKYGVITVSVPGRSDDQPEPRRLEKEMPSAEKRKLKEFEEAFGVLSAKTIDDYRKSGTFNNFSRDPKAKLNKNPLYGHDNLHKSRYASISYSHEPEFNTRPPARHNRHRFQYGSDSEKKPSAASWHQGRGQYRDHPLNIRRENNTLNEATGKGYPTASDVLRLMTDARRITMNEEKLAPMNAELARMAILYTKQGSRTGKTTIGDNYYKEYDRLVGHGITKRFSKGNRSAIKGGEENFTVTSHEVLVATLHDHLSIEHDLYEQPSPEKFLERFVKLYFQSKTIATTPLAQVALYNMARKALKAHKRTDGHWMAPKPGDPNYGSEGWTEKEWLPLDFSKDPESKPLKPMKKGARRAIGRTNEGKEKSKKKAIRLKIERERKE